MKRSPAAFTLIETLAVIAIIAFLTVLLVPTGKSMLERARSSQCMANLKNLTSATFAYAQDHGGEPPIDRDNNATGTTWYRALAEYLPSQGKGINGNGKPPYHCSANRVTRDVGNAWETNYGISSLIYTDGVNLGSPDSGASAGDWKSGRRGSPMFKYMQSRKALFVDSSDGKGGTWYIVSGESPNANAGWLDVFAVHGDRVNVAFLDGHIESPKVFPRTINNKGDLNELKNEWFSLDQ